MSDGSEEIKGSGKTIYFEQEYENYLPDQGLVTSHVYQLHDKLPITQARADDINQSSLSTFNQHGNSKVDGSSLAEKTNYIVEEIKVTPDHAPFSEEFSIGNLFEHRTDIGVIKVGANYDHSHLLNKPVVCFESPNTGLSELRGNQYGIEVQIKPASVTAFTLEYTLGGSATQGGSADPDYSILKPLIIPRDTTSYKIFITIINDKRSELDETVIIRLTPSEDYEICGGNNEHILTIWDDDRDKPIVNFRELYTSTQRMEPFYFGEYNRHNRIEENLPYCLP